MNHTGLKGQRLFFGKVFFWGLLGLWMLILDTSSVFASALAQEADTGSGGQIWGVLLPLAAAAIGVERGIEIFWNYIDWFLLNLRHFEPASLKSLQYQQFKSGTSLLIGIVVGILIAQYTGMRLFEYLKPSAPTFLGSVPVIWDVVITGVIIGAGSKPAHDLLGIITQFKNYLNYSAIRQRESAGAALAQGALALAKSDAQTMMDIPGMGPTRLSSPMSRGMGEEDDGEAEVEDEKTPAGYIRVLKNNTVI